MDFEEIVGAAGVPEEAVLVLAIFVSGAEPLIDESGFCFFGLIPVSGAEGIAFYPEIADFVGGGGIAGFIGDFRFKTGEDFAAGAGLYFAGTIGDDHMQAFRGAEGVEDFDAEAFAEAFEERRWQSFASGNGVADAGEIEVGTTGAKVIEECGVICGHGKKERWTIALDIGVDAGWRRTSGGKNCGGAAGEREVASVAETVGEKEARYAEAAVALVNFEDGVSVGVSVVMGADHHVVMKMDAALGDAGGTGRVKPEGGVVL